MSSWQTLIFTMASDRTGEIDIATPMNSIVSNLNPHDSGRKKPSDA